MSQLFSEIESLNMPNQVLMVDPEYFDILYEINPHMKGNVGQVNRVCARNQWAKLKRHYEELGFAVFVMHGPRDLVDMVFCANQSFPFLNRAGEKSVLLSQMAKKERVDEVPHFETWFQEHDYKVYKLKSDLHFEGTGDLLWHPGKRLLWGGCGFRTDLKVYSEIKRICDAPLHVLKLVDPYFYHLDTCLSLLNEKTALYCHSAFDAESVALLQSYIPNLIEVPREEALNLFACNSHCPDGKHVLIQEGCSKTVKLLKDTGFYPVEVDTSEFIKSGGSVFCLKLMVY